MCAEGVSLRIEGLQGLGFRVVCCLGFKGLVESHYRLQPSRAYVLDVAFKEFTVQKP